MAGIGGALPVSSSCIAILKVPSTITTTLAPTSSERIFEVMVEGSLPSVLVALAAALASTLALSATAFFGAARAVLSLAAFAAAACAARRAAAMKLDVETGSFGPVGIS